MLEEKNDNLFETDGRNVIENHNENQFAVDSIENSNAEQSEDETLNETSDVPMLDYEAMELDKLVEELESLVSSGRVASIKNHVDEIRKVFSMKFSTLLDEKKEEYLANNEGEIAGFEFKSPLKTKFDSLFNQYRDNKNKHYQALEANLKANLAKRTAIIEELKNLIKPEDSIQDTLKRFNEIRDRWRNAGPIPKDKYNHVWNSYHFHVENFYDYLHLDREARDIDFKYNYDQKLKIIAKAKDLLQETDIAKIFRELQLLHRVWKEEIGPVSKEHRESIWQEFSSITRQLHEKREAYNQQLRDVEISNLNLKKEIVSQIHDLANQKIDNHSGWQKQIEKIDLLRAEFLKIGRVPVEERESIWFAFNEATKVFNRNKNAFYKNIKKDQQDNLLKKTALLERALQLKDSEDFEKTIAQMKKLQEEWKNIGHVPKKYSDKLWADFKEACNFYFDKYHESRKEVEAIENEVFEKKKAYLETLKTVELSGDHKQDLDLIKSHIEAWKSLGKVSFNKRFIEGKFNKVLDSLFEKLNVSRKESEMMRFNNRLDSLSEDKNKLESEKIFIMRKIDEIQNEIRQLENNILFISNAKKDNPLVLEVERNIERHKETLKTWKDKLSQLRKLSSPSQEE